MEDASRMLEWMHDSQTIEFLQTSFKEKTIEDCLRFISNANNNPQNYHMAVIDNQGRYAGTVSLKDIDCQMSTAEFAIAIHSDVQGIGLAKEAMKEMLDIGVNEKNLKRIYWCVNPKNTRALRFYTKNGYCITQDIPNKYLREYNSHPEYIWFAFPSYSHNERKKA